MTTPYAFPSGDGQYGGGPNHDYGMLLRDWFAGQIVAALITTPRTINGTSDPDSDQLAQAAYLIADAMMKARGT